MNYARVFKSGNSQAVRLPKDFRFEGDRVEIFRRGDEIVLRLVPASAEGIFDAISALSSEIFEEKRIDPPPEERDSF